MARDRYSSGEGRRFLSSESAQKVHLSLMGVTVPGVPFLGRVDKFRGTGVYG